MIDLGLRDLGLTLLVLLVLCGPTQAQGPISQDEAQGVSQEQVQSDISTREIAIQSNFTGIEILVFGSIDFSDSRMPSGETYDVIAVVRGPTEQVVVRKKERLAGIWVNGPGTIYSGVPGFYAALSSRPIRAIASDETLRNLGIGLSELDVGRDTNENPKEQSFHSALIRLMEERNLFQEDDDGVEFVGRSLFRATVALPVGVPTGRYTVDVHLFRDGAVVSKSQGSLEVTKAGIEALLHRLALQHPFVYGLLGIVIAVLAGLVGWYTFRRD